MLVTLFIISKVNEQTILRQISKVNEQTILRQKLACSYRLIAPLK